ncbi:DUF1631 domain-containing protein [Oceanicoccus sp. KOV_DT_Chl]|uniref:DUF1631 domain-containing protein n=1 Tax=Oceanicoccus sp. KOV_DT_Chl TaxID=1904639 RepID=UPI000C7ACC0A|nr:DUF1631 domain-containing protein [Oceanicoccus sp. KOV_DT_Chl]
MKKDTDYIQAVNNSTSPKSLPTLLRQVKENSISILLAQLENLFSSCDDLFFDLSSRAESNQEQNLYFESMREVRLKKNGVIACFKSEIETGFHQLASPGASKTKHQQDSNHPEHHSNLSLVQNDILEQDVAISSMSSKARANSQEALYHLTLRFDYLTPHSSVDQNNNPLDPQQICNYFANASKLLELNIKARIILLKQFDRIVTSKLASVYSSANNLLIDAGTLPKTERYKKSSPKAEQSPAQPIQPNVEFDLEELSSILALIRNQSPEQLATIIPNYTAYSANHGPAISNLELVNLLTTIQHNISPIQDSEPQLAEDLRQIIELILSNQEDNTPEKSVHQPDDDVINLVAMFFEFVLDDKSLPLPAQALISRLQIPTLKIALRDKTFFSNGKHPARQLINFIAETSIGLDDSAQHNKDRLYSLLAKITQDIIDNFTDDDSIFSEKLSELQSFSEKNEHKSKLIEKRTEQAAEGQARTKLAKLMAQKIMFEKLETSALPDAISEFLTTHWLNLLVLVHLKHGEESPEWIDAAQLIDDLIWASLRHQDTKSQQRYESIKPNLLQRISVGMNQISVTSEAANEHLASIEKTLDKLASGAHSDLLTRPLSAAQASQLGHQPGGGSKSWQDMTGVERQQARYKQLTYEYIRKAEQLPLQTWISYTDHKSGNVTRCKLSVKLEASDTYVFVNRFGFKVLEKARKDFACDMQAGRAVILNSSNIFDRAMSQVLGNLNSASSPKPEKI